MYCWTPQINLPEAFKGWDQEEPRKRRASSSAGKETVDKESDLTLKTRDQTLDFYIGFKLDGVTSYKNLSDTKDMFHYGKISYLSTPPTIESDNHFGTFVPYTGVKISIKVMQHTCCISVAAHWVASEQVERSIVHQEHDLLQNSSH